MLTLTTSKSARCEVCEGPGRCINYGAYTCQACRAFFRRHGPRHDVISKCPWNGQCEITIHRQHQTACIPCRLNKCLSVGMSPKLIRKQEISSSKTFDEQIDNQQQVVNYRPKMNVPSLPTLDLLQQSRSTLTNYEWRLLSNVINAYDSFSSIPHARLMSEQLFQTRSLLRPKGSLTLEIVGRSLLSMRSMIASVPDFQVLTRHEQESLLERNWYSLAGFNYILILRDSFLIDTGPFVMDGAELYDRGIGTTTLDIVRRLDFDSVLVKIILVILTFSSNCLILKVPSDKEKDSLQSGTFRLFGSQNVFIELLWKYMIYRYGYQDSVIRFSRLIKETLNVIRLASIAYGDITPHQNLTNRALDDNKQLMSTNCNSLVPLWGKT